MSGEDQEKTLAKMEERMKAMEAKTLTAEARLREAEQKLKSQDNALLSDDYLAFLEQKSGKNQKAVEVDSTTSEVDFDSLTSNQLMKEVQKMLRAEVSKVAGESEKRTKELTDRFNKTAAYFDLQIAKTRDSELDSFLEQDDGKKRFIELSKENPSWDAPKIWKQIKGEETLKKAEETRKEAEKRSEEEKVIADAEELSPELLNKKDLSDEEAGEIAWQKAFGNKDSIEGT